MWVLDTNTLIYFYKGEGRVAEALFERAPRDIGIPAVALYELQVGIAKSSAPEKRTRQLDELTSVVQVLPFHQREARAAADIRATLENAGTPIGPYDTRGVRVGVRVKSCSATNAAGRTSGRETGVREARCPRARSR